MPIFTRSYKTWAEIERWRLPQSFIVRLKKQTIVDSYPLIRAPSVRESILILSCIRALIEDALCSAPKESVAPGGRFESDGDGHEGVGLVGVMRVWLGSEGVVFRIGRVGVKGHEG